MARFRVGGRLKTGTLTVALLSLGSGCVPHSRYETARTAAEQSIHARVDAERRLLEAGERLTAAEQARLSETGRAEQLGERIAELEYEASVTRKEREDAQLLVDQLRSELERVALHLREYSNRNTELASTLEQMEGEVARLENVEASAALHAKLLRDLALALSPEIKQGLLALGLHGTLPMVRLNWPKLWKGSPAVLTASGRRILDELARHFAPLEGYGVRISTKGTPEVETLLNELGRRGLGEDRVLLVSELFEDASTSSTLDPADSVDLVLSEGLASAPASEPASTPASELPDRAPGPAAPRPQSRLDQ